MNSTVPAGAALLLDFIAQPESGGDYAVIFGHHQRGLPKPITAMTLDELLTAQIGWGREWGSGAAGRYQMMQSTLAGAIHAMRLSGSELFTPDLQDRIGFWLMQRRGYNAFRAKSLGLMSFGKALAEEWASMPVLAATQGAHRPIARGQSYYAGDDLNKALVTADAFETALFQSLNALT